ncbi:MAG: sirohydrochlorin cobaltochelatase [Desulfomonilaceae bacterium]|nr:sirohydrochlorin cobaltochelatase [Desulfomonilaceae bacterium]
MTRRVCVFSLVIAMLLVTVPYSAPGSGHGEKLEKKSAVMLVAFGTSVPEALTAFDQIEKQVREAFPNEEVRWAFTSGIIRAKLREQGRELDPPAVALAKLLEAGYTHIAVASFHTLPGEEFHDLYQDVRAFGLMSEAHGRKILVSRPLLSSRENMEAVTKALLKGVPKDRKPEDAIVLMGHGSEHHPGDAVYAAMNFYSMNVDPNLFVGTVEGNPTLDDIAPKLKDNGVKKVYLMPLMAVAGDHARNDMCGDESDSWKSILKQQGFQVECVLKGTAENSEIVDIWLDNLRKIHAHFE